MVDAPADRVYLYLADMRDHHPRFLPPAFSDFQVESGGGKYSEVPWTGMPGRGVTVSPR